VLLKSPRHIFLWTTHHATVLMRRFLGHQLFFPWHGSTKSKIFGKQQASPAIWWCNLMHALSLSTLGTPFYQNWRWGKLKTKFVLFKIGSKAWGCFNPIHSKLVCFKHASHQEALNPKLPPTSNPQSFFAAAWIIHQDCRRHKHPPKRSYAFHSQLPDWGWKVDVYSYLMLEK